MTFEAKLTTGKFVILTRYGWHQPDGQYQAGPLTDAEVAEAWRIFDGLTAADKFTLNDNR